MRSTLKKETLALNDEELKCNQVASLFKNPHAPTNTKHCYVTDTGMQRNKEERVQGTCM